MKKHIKLLASTAIVSALVLSITTSAFAAAAPAPQQPGTRPGVTTPTTPTAPVPGTPAPITPTRPAVPSTKPQPAPTNPAKPTPNTPAQTAPGSAYHGHAHVHHNAHSIAVSGKLGGSVLLNLVEYYENLAEHGVISQETSTKAIDYMLNRYTGVSNNFGQIASENKSSAIKFEQRADGGAMFFEHKPDGKIIFFEQTPGKGAVYHEHHILGNVNALNSAIVHSMMVNEGVISKQEAQAISDFEAKSCKSKHHAGFK